MPLDTEVKKSPFEFDASFDEELDAIPEPAPAGKPVKTAGSMPVDGEKRDSPPAGTEAPRHSSVSLHFAKEFGFTDDEINDLSPKELDAAVKAAHRQHMRAFSQARASDIRERGGDKPPAPAAPTSSDTKTEEAPAEDDFADLAEVHEPIAKRLKDAAAVQKKLDAVLKRFDEADAREQARQRDQVFDMVDAEFSKMPAAVKRLIGEGGRADVKPGSLQHTIRKHILQAAEADQTTGRTFAQKMRKAAESLTGSALATESEEEPEPLSGQYGDEIEESPAPTKKVPPKDPVSGKFAKLPVEEREAAYKGAGTAKPTSRESPLPKGERRAILTARKIMIERGMIEDQDMPPGSFLPAPGRN